MTAPLTVTGVTEIADGVLRIPCDRAGLVFGAAYSTNVSSAAGVLGVILTNSVQSGVELAYTDDKERWQRLDPVADNRRRVITYHGYIWNRTDANQNWTFACGMETGAKLFLDGVEKVWENVQWYAFYNEKKIGFVTVPDVTPGCHQIDVRIYTTDNNAGWGTLADRLGVGNIVNATWTNYFGIGIDRQGRGSTHYADYERLLDPGDGSFLTVVSADAANAADVVAHMPQFAHLKFSGGEFDTRGSNLTVPVLEGFGVVTNSNDCYSGTLSVGGKWKVLAGDIAAGRALTVAAGALGFGGDAVLDVEGIEDLPRGEYNIATATGGIVGYPRFKCADRGLSGWHSVRRHDGGTGLDTIKFFWRMGLVVAFQ